MSYETPTEIAVRAYTELPGKKPVTGKGAALDTPSDWVLVFDTETTIDPSQALRIGSFQVREGGVLQRKGLFCEQEYLTPHETETVQTYAEERGLGLLTLWEFRRLFLKVGAKLNGTIVGFNLPFDVSRIAVSHGPARGSMRGGFSFKLSWDWKDPDVRVKHLSAKSALIDLAAPYRQRTARSGRKRGDFTPVHRGFFVDVKTLAAALTSRSFSLESLCTFLETRTRKIAADAHGETITEDYLDYALSDVQATWECYAELIQRFGQHGLSKPAHRILSEASIGKAYLEDMGRYFHPLLGTLITGAARLMLALAEQRTLGEGLDWVFCDTDSLAIAKPEDMPDAEFLARAHRVIDWFTPLNPYRKQGSILQIEDVNFHPETRELEPLFAWAISAKRYVLFNLSADGHPVLRKASQHGLGHLLAPYDVDEPAHGIPDPSAELSEIGLHRWQYDLWFQIVKSALASHPDQVPLDDHPKLQVKALSRYGATSPALLSWMKVWNADKPYRDQVKPFGFLSAFTAIAPEFLQACTVHLAEPGQRGRPSKPKRVKPIAPYERDPKKAVRNAIDRETGEPVLPAHLQSYGNMLAGYHLSCETKFENGIFLDQGRTRRRHVMAHCVRLIGKEANSIGEGGDMGPIPERLIDLDCAELSDT